MHVATVLAFLAVPALSLASSPVLAQAIVTTKEQPAQPDTSVLDAGTYSADPAHTQLIWEVNHMGISMLAGMLGASSGTLTIDPDNISVSELEVEFAVKDVAVNFETFSEHLLSAEFFDVETHPTARFVSTAVESGGANNAATIIGDLTIKGITHPVTIEAEFVGAGINPMDEKLHVGFHGSTTILRSDFDLGAYSPTVSDEVLITLNAAFIAVE